MEKQRALKISQYTLPALFTISSDSILPQLTSDVTCNKRILDSFATSIVNMSNLKDIMTLTSFWKNEIPEDADDKTKAIMYQVLYIITSSFNNDIASEFLIAISSQLIS